MSFDKDDKDTSNGTNDLTSWNDQFGDMEFFPEKSGGGNFSWEFGYAYACRIKEAKCVRSKFGDLQIELQVDVQGDDGEGDDVESIGSTRLWLDLPKQPSDIGKDKDLIVKLTQRRYQNMLRVLSAAAPAKFALYAEKKGPKNAHKFYDFDGELMSGSDFDERKHEIQGKCVV